MTDVEVLGEFLRGVPLFQSDQKRFKCPVCGPERKKKNERTLAVKLDGSHAIYKCHHCDISGSVSLVTETQPEVESSSKVTSLLENQAAWLQTRGIGTDVIQRCGLISGEVYINARNKEAPVIGFPYKNEDGTKATKWRDGSKNFSQTGSARSLWRIDEWKGGDLIICEGEIDACSFEQINVFATSAPNGAPARLSNNTDEATKKYAYLWDAKDQLKKAARIILATDNDEPGKNLSEEIARRVGKARCWKLTYPDGCKDPNDVLVEHGEAVLERVLAEATPWPVSGLRDVSEFRESAIDLFRLGMDRGYEVGVPGLDRLYRAYPQTLTICTGIPGSGKSAFATWLMLKLAKDSGLPCAVFSAETPTQIHLLQMAAALKDSAYHGDEKMDESELEDALDWLSTRFVFLDEVDTNIGSILERAQAAILRNGVRLLVIDPYNFITGVDEGVVGINKLLTSLKSFAIEHEIIVWLIAHPVKQYRGADGAMPIPGGYDISGSASFYNVCDVGLTVSRSGDGRSLITCWKSRFEWLGEKGEILLSFNRESGTFAELGEGGWDDEDLNLDDL